jgi:basic amino acid/polyamine antiporter, APA family
MPKPKEQKEECQRPPQQNKGPLQLKRCLGLWSATALNVGAIIGGGIFVVAGIVASKAGSAMLISMVIAAIIALLTALSFVELASWQPVEGSSYEYTRQLVSPFAGFLSGWMWVISNTFGGAAVSLGFAYYLHAAFPQLPITITAAVLCLAFTALNYYGAKPSSQLNNVFVIIKIAVLAFFVVYGLLFFQPGNFAPFAPLNPGVLFGAYFIFFAYGGFARATIVAEEIKDAERNVPRAVLFSLAISTVVYFLVGLTALGLVGAEALGNSGSPLTTAMAVSGNSLAAAAISFGGLVATASVLLTSILGVSRMIYSMSRRNDLPKALSKIHKAYATPYISVWTIGIAMTLLVLFLDLTSVVAVSTFALLFWYIFANISAFRLKRNKRKYPRSMPLIGLASCLVLFITTLIVAPNAFLLGIAFLITGATYYYLKNHKHQAISQNRV